MASVSVAAPRLRDPRIAVLAAAAAPPLVLLAARLLPATGPGLGLRLLAAAACVLVLPGAVLVRALGEPRSPAIAGVAALSLSLAVVFVALALTFAVGGTLLVAIGAIALATAAAVVLAVLRGERAGRGRGELLVVLGVLAAGLVVAVLAWWTTKALGTGDALFHLGRARRLADGEALSSLAVVNEFRDGGLHPGYAFPLWHGVLALVATLAGVDVSIAALHLSALLVPAAFLAAYAAGRALFDAWAGGVAVLAVQVAELAFSRPGLGSFGTLSLPASVTRVLLAPILLALAFAYVRRPERRLLAPLAAASLAVVVVHPSYIVLLAIPVAGFALLALSLDPLRGRLARSLGAVTAAVVVPAGLFLAWLQPVVADQASHRTPEAERARALAHYGEQLQTVGESFRMAPESVTGRGPVVLAALLLLPLAGLAVRRRWGAFAAGGMAAALAVLLVPLLFTALSDLMLVSQARRLLGFLPVAFAVAAAAVLLGRLRLAGAGLALALGLWLQLAYGGGLVAELPAGGPVWPLWVALAGGAAATVAGIVLGARLDAWLVPSRWTAVAALALVLPVAIAGLRGLERTLPDDPYGLSPGLVAALRELDREDVVFAPVRTAHRVRAEASVYVAATIPHHVADTGANRPYRRQRDTIRFFAPGRLDDGERRAMLARYGAEYLLADKRERYPRAFAASFPTVYEDRRYLLVRVRDA